MGTGGLFSQYKICHNKGKSLSVSHSTALRLTRPLSLKAGDFFNILTSRLLWRNKRTSVFVDSLRGILRDARGAQCTSSDGEPWAPGESAWTWMCGSVRDCRSWRDPLRSGPSPLPSLTCRWEQLSTLCHDGWNIYDSLFTERLSDWLANKFIPLSLSHAFSSSLYLYG